jgi:hypothetical protein
MTGCPQRRDERKLENREGQIRVAQDQCDGGLRVTGQRVRVAGTRTRKNILGLPRDFELAVSMFWRYSPVYSARWPQQMQLGQ